MSVRETFFAVSSCSVAVLRSNRIYGRHMTIHDGQFAECEVLKSQGHCSPRTRTRTCKLVFEDPRGQGLSSRTTTLQISKWKLVLVIVEHV